VTVSLKQSVDDALGALIGLPLWESRRSADVQGFHFGERRPEASRGKEFLVGTYALHVQCPWRIKGPEGILVGSYDRLTPAAGRSWEDPEFESDVPGASLIDDRIDALFALEARQHFVVESVEADDVGGFRMDLGAGMVLEAFPNHSDDAEFWRLFQPWNDNRHFVVTGDGIEE